MTVYLKNSTGSVVLRINDAVRWTYNTVITEHNGLKFYHGCDTNAGEYFTDMLVEPSSSGIDVDAALDIVEGIV